MTFIKTFEKRLDEAQFAYSLGEWISSSFATVALADDYEKAEKQNKRNKVAWFTRQDAEYPEELCLGFGDFDHKDDEHTAAAGRELVELVKDLPGVQGVEWDGDPNHRIVANLDYDAAEEVGEYAVVDDWDEEEY